MHSKASIIELISVVALHNLTLKYGTQRGSACSLDICYLVFTKTLETGNQ